MKKEKKIKLQATYVEDEESDDRKYKNSLLKLEDESLSFEEVLILTSNKDEQIRLRALQRLCSCSVGDAYEQFWQRIFEMVDDPSAKIRDEVLQNMCEGSPDEMENKVVEALEKFKI